MSDLPTPEAMGQILDATFHAKQCEKVLRAYADGVLVPVEPDMVLLIDEHGIEGEPFNRSFHADPAGEVYTDLLKPGEYAVIKIGDDDER